uniref:Uncharacterized protein n=1 Tax=Lactuca sativa TaxID=4236 RepID=A0A9R1VYP9_LACSA|nr:hypothetical protein LSAT_V11C400166020 [Lactuca sativa]
MRYMLSGRKRMMWDIGSLSNMAIAELKKKVSASKNLYISHIEALENVVRLHKESANGSLEDIAAMASSNLKKFNDSIHHTTNISEFINGIFDKLMEESKELGAHANKVDEIQTKSINEFQKAYEEQSISKA